MPSCTHTCTPAYLPYVPADAATLLIHDAATSLIQGDNCTFISAKVKTGDISFTGVDVNKLFAEMSGSQAGDTENISLADFQTGWKSAAESANSRADRQMLWDSIPALEYP